ncbi:class I SAM-dependent methyltransferase [Nocardioides bigeumensis]|uniref:class I SAM-dependent methyltransferase n=1 Tax=Nocardioides bigeumensis TaxID=433657 RepID=UPI0031D92CD6
MSESSPTTGTSSADYADDYYATYRGHEDYDWDTDHWREFFLSAAGRIKALTNAQTSLDVGCAKGLLVQALVSVGVDARGVDVSEHAVAKAHADVRDRLRVGSATEPIDGRYDLITCVEVLEHLLPSDAQLAIDRMCAATDLILFTSTPGHFEDPTHINVRPTAEWVTSFAERGFFRRTDANLEFLAPWAVLVQKAPPDAQPTARDLVHRYESQYATLHVEVMEKRNALLESHREIARLHVDGADTAEVRRLRERLATLEQEAQQLKDAQVTAEHEVLTTRDHIIGLEAKAEEAARLLVVFKERLNQQREKAAELQRRIRVQRRRAEESERRAEALLASRTWRAGRLLTRPFRRGR